MEISLVTLLNLTYVKGRITAEGVINIERVLSADRQKEIDHSILTTNRLSKINVIAALIFGVVVTSIQVRSCTQETRRDRQEASKANLDSLRLVQQSKRDSLLENMVRYIMAGKPDSTIGTKTFSKRKY